MSVHSNGPPLISCRFLSHWGAETDYTKVDKPSSGCLPVLVHVY